MDGLSASQERFCSMELVITFKSNSGTKSPMLTRNWKKKNTILIFFTKCLTRFAILFSLSKDQLKGKKAWTSGNGWRRFRFQFCCYV